MKTATRILLIVAVAVTAPAQSKPGDFTLDPLPAQQQRVSKMRSAARNAQFQAVRACGTDICDTNMPHACIEVSFPETGWRTCISNQGRRGLAIGPTDLRRGPNAPWMRVLREASIADIFVPYHFLPFRLYDNQAFTLASMLEVNQEDAGPHGELVTLSGQTRPRVVSELRDRGVAWICKERIHTVRRGQELVLWGVQDAANYDYIIEFRLRDDGSIGFRLGASGYNNPFAAPISTTDAHMHNVLWRVDIDLNGAGGDSARLVTHEEGAQGPLFSEDHEVPFNNGREGLAVWEPERFLTIAVEDETVNSYGNPIGYAIRGGPEGLARHLGQEATLTRQEKFTKSDFAVTRYSKVERDEFFDNAGVRYLDPDEYLLGERGFAGRGVSNGESVENADIVLWHRTSTHHDPHDEDHAPGDPKNLM
ncbi:MAG TPA: hypothetical protein VG106_10825, partial [Vicinamibacterales bacterium]|nr:hypothetical protein [Vicinamibacterales bacterium]